ncbi:response regulator [Daejeonella lutea]|uniref:histidine kinase n=1 Tax=Daejeonella lutea TaxID=572036 RepID=A0A1T5F131_9SPHI|nr:response regulator [Daejeonella lutea]SKB89700.1 Signal transduction histidine kinase [Daejeonella lutea]
MRSTFKRNIQIGFGLSLLVLILSSAASFISIRALLNSSKLVNHTNQVIQGLDEIMAIMRDAETAQRGYLLSGDENFLERYNGVTENAMAAWTKVKILVADNPVQQKNCDHLKQLLTRRIFFMKRLVEMRRADDPINITFLEEGKNMMDELRIHSAAMKTTEENLLAERTAAMNRFASYTPVLIIIAAILSLLITIFFYLKVSNDFAEKTKLQKDLEAKDLEIRNRIAIIQDIADKISGGDYKIRVNDTEKDDLGSLSFALNKMAESLDASFTQLRHKEWLQGGIARLNEIMVGEKNIDQLTNDTIQFIAEFTNSQVAAFYMLEDEKLKLAGSFAIDNQAKRQYVNLGEGVVGQCAQTGRPVVINNIPAENIIISFAFGDVKPASIAAIPVYHDYRMVGVIELGALNEISESILEFMSSVVNNIGIALYTSQIRKMQQELLEETQAQAEELQTQHSELENLNTELETQTQKIQASEEELRVQQEELLQSNQELEERSRLLEEKNQIIVERNLDIQQKAEQLELSTKYKSEFLANMSHELRTPLNSILLLSRLMSENKDLDKEQVEYAQVIQSAGQGLLSLIDEILDLSKIESGKMDLELRSVTLKEITNDLRSLFDPLAREKGIDLQLIIEPSAPELIVTDKLRLEQILKNLLSNALKFTSKGSIKLNISQPDNSNLIQFSVKDTGIGIPKEKQQQVFEAFQQADGSTRRKFGGTGLGLSISRELSKLLGGEIRLFSKPGEGSDFTVYIPSTKNNISIKLPAPVLVTEDEPKIKVPERFRAEVIPNEIEDDRNNLKDDDKIILIVEDDTVFAKALLDYTRKQNYKGVVAVRGDQGLEMAALYKPIAILLDIQLPVKDGWEVMEELKSNPSTRHIPVHIMSSMEVKKESLMKGAVDFINKPIALDDMNQIFKKLEEALSRHPKKVMIIEENPKHAKALGYFLSNFNINSEISGTVSEGINLLNKNEVDCVILDMGIPDQNAYETLELVKSSPGLENLPIIIFTGKNLSKGEENKIKQYADSIVVKTAHSYQRILDEVGLFLHVVEDNKKAKNPTRTKTLGGMDEVLKGKTVLIADDDVRNIFSLTKALEKHNMQVVSAIDGKEALKILDENPLVDIVLMDMMMPEMDGYESTTRIRRNPKYKQLPILAVTAKAMMGDREKCIKAGASDYISKPVDIDQLISLLRVWLYDK